ncbi:MAG: sugar transferase [Chloroflexi bacterium]|nr:sugar transferase [Chloroflexota bacterium]
MKDRRLFLILIDLVFINAAVVIAFVVWSARGDVSLNELLTRQAYWFGLLSVLWFLFEFLSGMYDLRVAVNMQSTARALMQTFFIVLLAYIIFFFFVPTELPRGIVVYHGIAALILISMWRSVFIRIAKSAPFRRRGLIVGAGWAGQAIAQVIQEQYHVYYDLIGFIDDDPAKRGKNFGTLKVLGDRDDLVRIVKDCRIAEIILAVTHDIKDELFRELLHAQEQGIEMTPMPLLYEELTGRVPVEHIGDSWYLALPLGDKTASVYSLAIKRLFDIFISSIGLVGFGLLMPFIALAIRLDSPGRIFYSQTRVGQGGKIFSVRKLRTMVTNAERNGQAVWATKNDPRVTRLGKYLRKLHIDELPQFWNVLRGEMSIVGPRPERPEFVSQLENQIPFYRLRHAVKPGMAGWAIVNAGYVDSVEDARVRVEYDLYYIKHQSIWLDLWILFRMAGHILAFGGQ